MPAITRLTGASLGVAIRAPDARAPQPGRWRHAWGLGWGITRLAATAVLGSVLAACGAPAPPPVAQTGGAAATVQPDAQQPEDRSRLPFVGKVWIAAMPGSPHGSMLIFLADGTLVMDSCFETYRLSRWGMAGDHVRWLEDTIPIQAEVSVRFNSSLRLRINDQEERTYIAASVPYTCPDMPR